MTVVKPVKLNYAYILQQRSHTYHFVWFGVLSIYLTFNFSVVCFSGNFTCLEVIFKFRRRLGYYLFHTYIPTCLIVMMSWISFWIKPEAVPARVTLGVTSLLTLSTQHANSQKSLPPVSYIKVCIHRYYHRWTVSNKKVSRLGTSGQ